MLRKPTVGASHSPAMPSAHSWGSGAVFIILSISASIFGSAWRYAEWGLEARGERGAAPKAGVRNRPGATIATSTPKDFTSVATVKLYVSSAALLDEYAP